jgi:predicted DNA-binding protein YlxM (UPF0122 family)
MDPEDLTDSEEDEDDDMMFFILPTLYLVSTGSEEPCHTSKFSGAEWICEVLEDDRGEGYAKFRMEPQILQKFSDLLRSKNLLRNTRGVSVEEQIGMFIYMLSRNASFQKMSDRFEHSRETIHRHIKACFDAITSLTDEFVKHPSTETHWKISSDPQYGPYFKVGLTCLFALYEVLHFSATSESVVCFLAELYRGNRWSSCTYHNIRL